MGSIDFIALYALGDMHQKQRPGRTLVTLNLDMRHAAGEALGQMQENLRLNRGAQTLAFVVNHNPVTALPGVIAQFRVINAVDKDQPYRIHGQRQGISSLRTDRRRTRHKLAAQQAI